MERWVGKVAVVTGASSGIGACIAEKLVKDGLLVVGMARRVEKVKELAKKLSGKKGKLYAVKADITKETDIVNAIDWTVKNVGPISILINNAGVVNGKPILEATGEDFKQIFETNVIGLCVATREAVANMKKNNIDGHVVHINSIAGHSVPNLGTLGAYPASKYAVTALTESLRLELNSTGSKIKVTSVSPGYVDTPMTQQGTTDIPPELFETFSKMPTLKPEDVANAVLYSLSTPPHVQVYELTIKPVGEIL